VEPAECENCDGSGCPCMRWRDWYSMELGCECGCHVCGAGVEAKPQACECAYTQCVCGGVIEGLVDPAHLTQDMSHIDSHSARIPRY